MKKFLSLLIMAGLLVSSAGCGSVLVDLDTPKSEELSAQYDYYGDSMNTIRAEMGITPEQADEVFIALLSCGLDGKISAVSKSDGLYTVRWGTNSLDVAMNDGAVSEVMSGKDVLYPALSDEEIGRLSDEINMGIGEADKASVSYSDRTINITVTLGDISSGGRTANQLAADRASSITDGILDLESVYGYWDSIVITFDGVGQVTRTKNDIKTNESGGKYFDSSDFERDLS